MLKRYVLSILIVSLGTSSFAKDIYDIWSVKEKRVQVSADVISDPLERPKDHLYVSMSQLTNKLFSLEIKTGTIDSKIEKAKVGPVGAFFGETKSFAILLRGKNTGYLVDLEVPTNNRCKIGRLERITANLAVPSTTADPTDDTFIVALANRALRISKSQRR